MVSDTKPNSMAKGNSNKTKKKDQNYHSMKAYNLGDINQRNLQSPLSDQNINVNVVKQDLPYKKQFLKFHAMVVLVLFFSVL